MSDRSERLQDLHNRGEQDYADDKGYNAPHPVIKELFTFGEEAKQDTADNVAYRTGWENARDQDKS